MVIILPQDRRYAEAIESFGGIGESLGYLAGSKLKQIKLRNAYRQAGLPENQAEALSYMPAAQQQQAYQQFVERAGFPEQQQQGFIPQQNQQFQFQPQTMQRLGALQAMNMPKQQRKPQQFPSQNIPQLAIQGAQVGPSYQQALATGRPQDQLAASQVGLKALQQAQQTGALGYPQQQAALQQPPQQRQPGSAPSLSTTGGIAPQLPGNAPITQPGATGGAQQVSNAPSNPLVGESPKLRAARAAGDRAIRQQEIKERQVIDKENRVQQTQQTKQNKEEYKKINKEYEVAEEQKSDLDRMRKLIKKGNLSYPAWHSFLNTVEHGIFGFGINLHSLETTDSQEYTKLTARMLNGIKDVFPRATNLDVQQYLKQIPNLSQSNEAKLRNIAGLEKVIKAKEIRKKEADKILKENKGVFPSDFDQLLSERIEPKTAKLYNDFVNSINSEDIGSTRASYDLVGRGLDRLLG